MDFPGHFEHIFQQLNHQRTHGQLCDCVIVVGSQHFRAHRSVLAACSTHFRALLSTVDGDGGGGASVMELDQEVVTSEAFAALLDMIYTSTLTLGASNVMDVLLAASHLHLNTVVRACKHHLTSRNFPTSPPHGWRSSVHTVDQHMGQSPSQTAATAVVNSRQQRSVLLQQLGLSLVSSALEGGLDKEEAGVEASQAGGKDGGVGTGVGVEQQAAFPTRRLHKRKSSSPQAFHEERPSSKQRTSRLTEEDLREGSPRVTRSIACRDGAEELPSPDSLKTDEGLLLEREGAEQEEEEEAKYETTRGESSQEEIQLPSQSDSSVQGAKGDDKGEGHTDSMLVDGGIMVKVKVGEEEEEEEEQKVVVVKSEHLSSLYPETSVEPNDPPSPTEDNSDPLDEPANDEKVTTSLNEDNQTSTNLRSCTDLQTETHREGSNDDEGLDSQGDLGLSCILSPRSQCGSGEVREEKVPYTAFGGEIDGSAHNLETTNTLPSSSSSSLVFPVTSVPYQQLLAGESQSFSDTVILQPTQDMLGGYLRGVGPSLGSLSLHPSLSRPNMCDTTRGGGSLGVPAFRRIAPKVIPNSEAQTDGTQPQDASSSSGPAALPVLTRASEDVLSKCKKALMEHNVIVVEGTRKYACRICCKTFRTLTDCKKHIRVHTGEKPYACLKCGKCFSQSSHLCKHSKTTCLRWKSSHLPATML